MPHTTPTDDPGQEKSTLKLMLLALATALVALIQALLLKPFRR
jgi:hypothetical protein